LGLLTRVSFMLCGRFFRPFAMRLSQPAMNTILVASFLTAFVVNVVCLLGHL
jgi:hypothetical protein